MDMVSKTKYIFQIYQFLKKEYFRKFQDFRKILIKKRILLIEFENLCFNKLVYRLYRSKDSTLEARSEEW